MELEYKEEYIDLLSKEAYSHAITTGIIVSIILALASSIVLIVVFRILNLVHLLIYLVALVIVPINVLTYIVAHKIAHNVLNEAKIFVDVISKVANTLNTTHVELLETPPPPYTSVLKTNKYYVVVSYYGYRGVHVTILDPVKIDKEEGYAAIYMKKSRELLATIKINNVDLRIYRLLAVLPEPVEDAIVEGSFYSYEFTIYKLDPDKLISLIRKVFMEIKRMRQLYPREEEEKKEK